MLRFVKLSENAFAPMKGSELAAGLDLRRFDNRFMIKFWHWWLYVYLLFYSAYECSVPARGKFLVKTDLQVEIPPGCYGRIAPRSGLAVKNFIDVGGKNCSELIKFSTIVCLCSLLRWSTYLIDTNWKFCVKIIAFHTMLCNFRILLSSLQLLCSSYTHTQSDRVKFIFSARLIFIYWNKAENYFF